MNNIWTIAKREYKQYFASPAAYVIAFFLMVFLGAIFIALLYYAQTQGGGEAPNVGDASLWAVGFIMVFITTPITARLLTDEQRLGTIELLLTSPVRDVELVIGKWLGALLFMLTLVALTWIYPIILNLLVDPGIDQTLLVSGYLGVVLLCAALCAIGVAISSLFSNQVATFITTLITLVLMWFIFGPVARIMGPANSGSEVLGYLDLSNHYYTNFLAGVVDLRDVVFFVSLTALGLFIATAVLESRRWR